MLTTAQFNRFLFFKLPSAFLCGVRVKNISDARCDVSVRHRWINQNPFKSMYFAVQAMAAELSTGALVIAAIRSSGANLSMLVAQNRSVFTKKATGRIRFRCDDGRAIAETIAKAIETGDGQTLWMRSEGVNEQGETVSRFEFEWTVKVKTRQ
jgi:hypothetical protein